ncbi:MAG: FkbM family methyltransferase [Acidimicrobiia bacterium]|nr:FkbM family methyltransferase [Acidimicrobiia bacterium]
MSNLKTTIKRFANKRFDSFTKNSLTTLMPDESISFLDVGAANGAPPRWFASREFIDYCAVEPDPRSSGEVLQKETESRYKSERLITKALWNKSGEVSLNLCRKAMTSSIYVPNDDFAKLFPDSSRLDIIEQIALPCTTINEVTKNTGLQFDAIKLDIQGAELNALLGAERSLSSVLAVEVEVEFYELYRSQPLFDSVFNFLRSQGYDLIDFISLYRWSPREFTGLGQLTFSDALFMRPPEKIAATATESEIRKYASICVIYRRGDMLVRLASALESRNDRSKLTNTISEIGTAIEKMNLRTIKLFNFASKVIQVTNPSTRAYMTH